MSDTSVLRLKKLAKRFGALVVTDDLSFEVMPGELHALIGPNGAGKSTLMKQLSGEIEPDGGHIHYFGRDITRLSAAKRARAGIARSYQITSVFPEYTALENVATVVQTRVTRGAAFLRRAAGDRSLDDRAMALLSRVGLGHVASQLAADLAHGQQRQLEFAMALALEPRLLLLDEPMAGMGTEESAIMVQLLKDMRGELPILLVEHDMDAVFALADRVTVLVYGRAIASGSSDAVRRDPAVREAYLGDDGDAS
ncbi:MAG: ABC transporter ATP-binding protein [Roseovarius sp.]|uniref:ABC transporter ATP-binding protein n=1 Tax=Roseovarius sp. TaxID=1486281 RepID=UPI0032EECA51